VLVDLNCECSSRGTVEDSRDSSRVVVWSDFSRLVLSGLRKPWLVGIKVSGSDRLVVFS
jgi:hypothetical protein